MILFWDKDGTPLETLEWAHKYEDYSYRFVGHDQVGTCRISTLWMGMPPVGLFLRFNDGGPPPAVFQTMVFAGEDLIDERNYYTEVEALAGHQELVTLARWYADVDVAAIEKGQPWPPPA